MHVGGVVRWVHVVVDLAWKWSTTAAAAAGLDMVLPGRGRVTQGHPSCLGPRGSEINAITCLWSLGFTLQEKCNAMIHSLKRFAVPVG